MTWDQKQNTGAQARSVDKNSNKEVSDKEREKLEAMIKAKRDGSITQEEAIDFDRVAYHVDRILKPQHVTAWKDWEFILDLPPKPQKYRGYTQYYYTREIVRYKGNKLFHMFHPDKNKSIHDATDPIFDLIKQAQCKGQIEAQQRPQEPPPTHPIWAEMERAKTVSSTTTKAPDAPPDFTQLLRRTIQE